MSEAKLLVVWQSREIVVDDFGRNLFKRIGIPLRLPASVNEYGPNSLVEVRVLAKSSHQSENQCLNMYWNRKVVFNKEQRKHVKMSRNIAFKFKEFKGKNTQTV